MSVVASGIEIWAELVDWSDGRRERVGIGFRFRWVDGSLDGLDDSCQFGDEF